jgi:hypothetical protein
MQDKYEVILTESFRKAYSKIKDGGQKRIILNFFDRLSEQGANAVKILYLIDHYILSEMKSHSPPYRLYIILDQSENKFYIVGWVHKDKQQQTIEKMKFKLKAAIKTGVEAIF